MNQKRRTHRDLFQNILIVLLSLSAVLLFMQSQRYSLGDDESFFGFFSGTQASDSHSNLSMSGRLSAPVHIAVSGAYGRYGSVTLSTADEAFDPLAQLLADALASAGTYSACTGQDFLSALNTTSIYYDFLSPLPLSALADLVNVTADTGDTARYLVLSVQEDGVRLHIWDDALRYLHAPTALSAQDLEQTLDSYELGNAQFAMDLTDSEFSVRNLSPCSLLLSELPVLPVLNAALPAADSNRLLTGLQFNPNTQARYHESTGAEVIRDGGRTLRIHPDGTVFYQSGNDPVLTLDAAAQLPTVQEAVAGSASLLNTLLGSSTGAASLYLQSVRQSGNAMTLVFAYQSGGVPIRFSDGGSAAVVTLQDAAVTSLTLRLRQYTVSETLSPLLPLRQTLALTEAYTGAELSIGYIDDDSSSVRTDWLID